MTEADKKARDFIEQVRCAQINFENAAKSSTFIRMSVHFQMAKRQLDCAIAILDGKPEPELKP